MKKALSIFLLSCALFAVTSKAHASPPTVIVKEAVNQVMPVVFEIKNYEAIGEVFTYQIYTDNVLTEQPPGSTVQVPEIGKENILQPDSRIRMHRHYFDHEDNKEYPEYQVDNLSDGFVKPVDRPALK